MPTDPLGVPKRAAQPVGVSAPAPAAAPLETDADPQFPHLSRWAATHVVNHGLDPSKFQMHNGTLAPAGVQFGSAPAGPAQAPAAASAIGQAAGRAAVQAPALQVRPAATSPGVAPGSPYPQAGAGSARGVTIYRGGRPPERVRPGYRQDVAGDLANALHHEIYRGDPGNVPAMAAALSNYENGSLDIQARHAVGMADARNNSPEAQIGVMNQIATSPHLRALYMGGHGDPTGGAGLPPISAIGPDGKPLGVAGNNLTRALGAPENVDMNSILNAEGGDLVGRLRQLRSFPGMSDPNHANHQIVQSWINRQYAANPHQWAEDTYVPPNPDATGIPGPINRAVGLLGAAGNSIWGDHSGGTGMNWRQNYQDRTDLAGLLRQYGINAPIGAKANAIAPQ